MTIQDVLFFDTETTGIPARDAKWDVDFMEYPHIVQIAWIFGETAESHLIRPDGWEIPEEAVAVHGITTEYAIEHGEPFVAVIDRFISFALAAPLLCGHNIHFDTGIVKANILRELGQEYFQANDVETALYKGKRIDTMRPAMKWVDARNSFGRLKFPNLGELYDRCFPGETFPAHDAMADTKAVKRCLPVLVENGIVALEVKTYPEEQAETPKTDAKADAIASEAAKKFGQPTEKAENAPNFASNEKDDKLPVQQEKGPQNENSAKITADVAELLEQNDF